MDTGLVTDAQKQQFVDIGYFILEDLFDADEMDAVEAVIDSRVEEANDGLKVSGGQGISRPNEIVFTAFLAEKDDSLLEFVKGPKFVDITTRIIGPDVRLYWNQAVYKFPETHKEFPWHQDNGYTPVDPEQYYTCWLALGDATIDNGCVWLLPGSHKDGTRPHTDSDIGRVGYTGEDEGVPVAMKRGSMAVFSSLLLHRSGQNVTQGEVRKGYIVQFIPSHTRSATTGEAFTDRLWVAKEGVRYDGE
ncbi:MAG: phytanoyl-CoA dioxygenase family protein [Candidatus Poribacteria bacterium]